MVLFKADPLGITFSTCDEYDGEAASIVKRLPDCETPEDALTMIWQEFQRWFSVGLAGQRSDYLEISQTIWTMWVQYLWKVR
jgi:hypothetical protein